MNCQINDVSLYYEEYGEGKPVLCLHGYSVDHGLMTGCLEPIFNNETGYRRIYFDLPGMGKSTSAPWVKNADAMLTLITEFIRQIIPEESFLIIGESYGAYLTLGLIRDMAERIDGAFFICPVITTQNRTLPEKTLLYQSADFQKITENVKPFLAMAVIATPEIYEKYKTDIMPGLDLADYSFLDSYSNGYGFTFEEELENVVFDKPTGILSGRQDFIVGYHDAYAILPCFPRASYAVLDFCGHNLQIENEPLLHQHVKDWLWRTELNYTQN